jgi:diguanylate cyclase (GGDEF)-like protein
MSVQDDVLVAPEGSEPEPYAVLAEQYAGHPLLAELLLLNQKYQRLERRLNKITRIGDLMQAQIMELNIELNTRANTDPLTGLLNRSGLYPQMTQLADRMMSQQQCFGVLLLDLDYFKEVNDQFGHLKGDQLLVAVANILQSITATNDVCARWGGEEFLILLPVCNEMTLISMAESIMRAIRSLQLPGAGQRTLTASIGVYFCQQTEVIDESIRKADLAMYKAKEQGRDQLVVYAPSLGETRVVL